MTGSFEASRAKQRELDRRCLLDTPDPKVRKPSLFFGGVIGFSVAALIAGIVCWALAVRARDFENQRVVSAFVCIAALGTFEGYRLAARKRKRLGVNEPADEWQKFVGSATFYALAAVVLVGSLAISVAESLLFDLVFGAPWLQNR
jgi:hypothetical protein